eukprot:CAMPEP_0170501606 /NCGR_PEP_ID=MMETSP0208-20121228/38855_1 /TAXON_ID=197538 /ORGANISM="Strombidium inclinatum, Strain S3" /LENGTH=172 /DNA_ID=CAMNT_0010780253 /DNA_START=147 /DNA_END=665 /DNA_ORIENTATION=-
MKDNEWGYDFDFYIARIYRSNGKVDPVGIQNYQTAVEAGINTVHAYIFPDPKKGDPQQQIWDAMNALEEAGMEPNTYIWLDIEDFNWPDSQADNREFIAAMVDCASGMPPSIKMGIYSSYYNWEDIVGLDWTYPADHGMLLWYAHYDNSPEFADYKHFGGWVSPTIKQFAGD